MNRIPAAAAAADAAPEATEAAAEAPAAAAAAADPPDVETAAEAALAAAQAGGRWQCERRHVTDGSALGSESQVPVLSRSSCKGVKTQVGTE